MALVNGATYRLENRADPNRSLNVYGTSPASLANVCLWSSDDDDICQQWVYKVVNGHKYFACKANQNLALDLYTGSGSSNVTNYNAHVYAPSSTSYVEIEDSTGDYIQIRLEDYSNKYLTANQGSNGTSGGKDVNAAGNVYFYNGGLTDYSQDWLPVRLDGGPTPDPDPDPEAQMTLAQLKNKFPAGKYWNHVGMSGNNQDGYTSSPCPNHANGNVDTCNAFELNGVEYSWQCMGFAEKCGYDFSGTNPRVDGEWTTYVNASALDNLKPGDIVRYFTNRASDVRHSIFVTGVSGDTVTFGDCNADNKCGIRWNATISKQTLSSQFVHLRSAPFTLA